jgi:ABC-type polysaccharide/polyol phosphate export permease
MGWLDIRRRYRRSLLGPFWLTLSMSILIASLGLVYGSLFKLDLSTYLPFLAVGMAVWSFLATILIEGCQSFVDLESLIKQIRLPLSVHVLRTVWRDILIFAHNMVIYVGVALWFGIWPGVTILLAVPGLLLIFVNAVWIVLLLGMVCARFRDVPQIVASLSQLLFFVTPVMWRPELIHDRQFIVTLNPFHHLIELVRSPLLGIVPGWQSWASSLLFAALGWSFTFYCFTRFRKRIAYWL